jgi:hypothetical protein
MDKPLRPKRSTSRRERNTAVNSHFPYLLTRPLPPLYLGRSEDDNVLQQARAIRLRVMQLYQAEIDETLALGDTVTDAYHGYLKALSVVRGQFAATWWLQFAETADTGEVFRVVTRQMGEVFAMAIPDEAECYRIEQVAVAALPKSDLLQWGEYDRLV